MLKRLLIVVAVTAFSGLVMSTHEVESANEDVRIRELKHQLDHALFTRHWRRPDRTGWVAKPVTNYTVVRYPDDAYSNDDPTLLFTVLDDILNTSMYRFIRPEVRRVSDRKPYFRKHVADELGASLFIPLLASEVIVEGYELLFGPWPEREIADSEGMATYEFERKCLARTRFDHDRRLWGIMVLIVAKSSQPIVRQCLTEALYVAHGVVDARSPYRDTALNVLMHPAVENGMSKEELYRLIDDGVIDSEAVLAPPAEIRELDLSRR